MSGKERERDEDNEDDHEYGSWTKMLFMVGLRCRGIDISTQVFV